MQFSAIAYLWFEEFILLWSVRDAPKRGEVVIADNCCLQMKPEMLSKLYSYQNNKTSVKENVCTLGSTVKPMAADSLIN